MNDVIQWIGNKLMSFLCILFLPIIIPVLWTSLYYGGKHGWFDQTD